MVEIGHNTHPVAFQQPFQFTGGRAYIGVEAWLREGQGELEDTVAILTRQGHNIVFLTQDIGGGVYSDRTIPTDEEAFFTWYEGPYNTRTPLSDGAGDEVFLGDVATDPHIGENEEFSTKLLTEVSRLAGSEGMIVLREHKTPHRSTYILDEEFLALFGLSKVGFVTRDNPEDWARLHPVYRGDISSEEKYPEKSFFMFLAKTATN